jgi:hypothetical protein
LLRRRLGWVPIGLLQSGHASLEEGSVSETSWVKYDSQLSLAVPFDGASSGGNSNVTGGPDYRMHTHSEDDGAGSSCIRS